MQKTIRAGFVYFALVLGTGFVLGVFRVPFLVPRIGERWAELAAMPVMAAAGPPPVESFLIVAT